MLMRSTSVLGKVVLVREDLPVRIPDIPKGRQDAHERRGRAGTERPWKRLNANLADPVALQHGLDRELGPDERAVGPQFEVVDHRLPHQAQSRRDVPERGSKEKPEQFVVDPRNEEPLAGVNLLVPKRNDEVVIVTQPHQLPEVLDLVLIVSVREADVLESARGEP